MVRASGTMMTWKGMNMAARQPRNSTREPRNRKRLNANPAIDPNRSRSATEPVTTMRELAR
jgi:hypothetical protein